jgi:hypothetical protein
MANQGYVEVGLKPWPETWPHKKPQKWGTQGGGQTFTSYHHEDREGQFPHTGYPWVIPDDLK